MGKHAQFSPSSAEKRMSCVGSLAMEEGIPDPGSDYADEGTAAHFLQAHCLQNNHDPVEFLGKSIVVWDHSESDSDGCSFSDEELDMGCVIRNSFDCDVDFVGYVRTSVRKAREYAEGGTMFVEQEVPLDHINGEEGSTGTSDVIILQPDLLIINDLKFGRGEAVSPVENKQMLMYASGAIRDLTMLGFDIPNRIKLVIHQPRIQHEPLEWDCTVEDVKNFELEAAAIARTARIALEHRKNWITPAGAVTEMSYLNPTEKGCRWCRAKPNCPAAAAKVEEILEADFEKLGTTTVEPAKAVALMVQQGSVITLSQKMAAVGLIEDWCKAVRAEVERRLFANEAVPGYKLVQGKKGNRKWSDEAAAEEMLKKMRVKHDQMYQYKVITPPQAEKVFKAGGIGERQWPKLQALIVQAEGGPSVAPESDPRPVLAPVVDSFEVLPEGGDLC